MEERPSDDLSWMAKARPSDDFIREHLQECGIGQWRDVLMPDDTPVSTYFYAWMCKEYNGSFQVGFRAEPGFLKDGTPTGCDKHLIYLKNFRYGEFDRSEAWIEYHARVATALLRPPRSQVVRDGNYDQWFWGIDLRKMPDWLGMYWYQHPARSHPNASSIFYAVTLPSKKDRVGSDVVQGVPWDSTRK